MENRLGEILLCTIQKSTENLLNFYYGVNIKIDPCLLEKSFYIGAMVKENKLVFALPIYALKDSEVEEFRLLFTPVYNKNLVSFTEALLDNLVVEICNCVAYAIIDGFSYRCDPRIILFRSNFLSPRNLERFKNNLNWQSRVRAYIVIPSNIYSSEYGIWIIRTTGVYFRIIYTNRFKELTSLTNFPLITLLAVEAKDFLNSRLGEIVYSFGNLTRYIFISIIGQFAGLVWRGIIEGLKK